MGTEVCSKMKIAAGNPLALRVLSVTFVQTPGLKQAVI